MKVHELIRDLAALAGTGLSDADVEVLIVDGSGYMRVRDLVSVERSSSQKPGVVLTAAAAGVDLDLDDSTAKEG